MGFARELVIESKLFTVVREGGLNRIFERVRRFKQELLLGLGTAKWLRRALEDCAISERRDFYASIREGHRSVIAQRCSNNWGRFMEVAAYGEGNRRSCIILPEGEGARGWRRMEEVLLEATMEDRDNVGFEGGLQKKTWKKTEGVSKSYEDALFPAGSHGGLRTGAGGGGIGWEGTGRGHFEGDAHQAHHVFSQESDYGRDMYCMVREVQKQMRYLQRELDKVVRSVGVFKENNETVGAGGKTASF